MTFEKILSFIDGPVSYQKTPYGHLKLSNHDFPWSINEREFNFIYDTIVNNKLTKGYEACTGVGISGLAAALAMKKTGGKVVSLDSYVEERLNHYSYDDQKILLENADGYKSVFYLRKKFEVENEFIPEVGWTPDNVSDIIEKYYDEKLDYVFIDGGHIPEQLILDIKAVLPYTDKNTFWLFHDAAPSLWTQEIENFCRTNIGKTLIITCPASEGCNDLGILIDL